MFYFFVCPISFYNEPFYNFLGQAEKNLKKGVDESQPFVLYYDSRADESCAGVRTSTKLETVQDVPWKLHNAKHVRIELTSQMQHRCEGGNTFGQRTQFFYKNELLSQQALG